MIDLTRVTFLLTQTLLTLKNHLYWVPSFCAERKTSPLLRS